MNDFPDGTPVPDTAEQRERLLGGFWAKLWRSEEVSAPEPEPLAAEAPPGEELAQGVSEETEIPSEVLEVPPEAALEKRDEELQRLSRELEHARQADAEALEELRAEVLVGIQQANQEAQRLKEEVGRLREELEQAKATDRPAPERGSRKGAKLTAELARRNDEIRDLKGQITAAREDTNRNAVELDMLCKQMAELCLDLITPITVLSASADLLAMRQDIPQDALASLEDMRQSTATVRQVIARMQKVATTGDDKT